MTTKKPYIGSMDRKIVIQQSFVDSRNDSGEPVTGWAEYATVWANVSETGGIENEESGQIQEVDTIVFVIRWIEGITAKMRILYDGKFFNVRSVAEIGRRQFLKLKTDSRDNDLTP